MQVACGKTQRTIAIYYGVAMEPHAPCHHLGPLAATTRARELNAHPICPTCAQNPMHARKDRITAVRLTALVTEASDHAMAVQYYHSQQVYM